MSHEGGKDVFSLQIKTWQWQHHALGSEFLQQEQEAELMGNMNEAKNRKFLQFFPIEFTLNQQVVGFC